MAIKILGLIIGILVLSAGIYYLVKEEHDPESKKIYAMVSVIGGGMILACTLMLLHGRCSLGLKYE